MANVHDLSRPIPEDVKRTVRQRCGFCCVHCTSALYHYDHFETPYKDASEHDPDKITLLCASAHDAKTRGHIADSTVQEWDAKRRLDLPPVQSMSVDLQSAAHPSFDFGKVRVFNTPVVLRVAGKNLIEFLKPETQGGPFRLNAEFTTTDGSALVRIRENEWLAPTDVWDIQTEGPTTTMRTSQGDIAFRWRVNPPDGVAVERLRMSHQGFHVDIGAGNVQMHLGTGTAVQIRSAVVLDAPAAIDVDTNGRLLIGKGGEVRFSEARVEYPGVTNEMTIEGIQIGSYSDFFGTLASRDRNLTLRWVFVDDRPKHPPGLK